MMLIIDEVYTAKCLEHTNRTFVEVTEGQSAQTGLGIHGLVILFQIQRCSLPCSST